MNGPAPVATCELHKVTGKPCDQPAVGVRRRTWGFREVHLCREHFDAALWCHNENCKNHPWLEREEKIVEYKISP